MLIRSLLLFDRYLRDTANRATSGLEGCTRYVPTEEALEALVEQKKATCGRGAEAEAAWKVRLLLADKTEADVDTDLKENTDI